MNKLEELKQFVAGLFEAATDKEIIEKNALVQQKISEAEEEHQKLEEDYKSLLNDYKDVVLHSSFKPSGADTRTGIPGSFDADAAFNQYFTDHKE